MDYSAINTKIKAMRANLLNLDDYIELSKSKNVEDIANKLQNFNAYHDFISSLEHEKFHRGYIESKLMLSLMSDFKRIYNFVFDYELKKYLSAFFLRNEIHVLKLILSIIYDKRNIEYELTDFNFLIEDKLNIDVNKLKSSSSVQEFINNLAGTQFFDLLNDTYKQSQRLFDLEMKLDLYYYIHLHNLQKKYLHGENKIILSKIKDTEIDLINISWLYRIKKYYNFDNTTIFSYLLPIKYKLSENEISLLVNANTMPEFEKIVYNTYYGDLFKAEKLKVEHVLYKALSRIYYKFYLQSKDNIVSAVYYIYLKQLEINNITSLIEGIRYNLPSEKIISYLYLKEV